MKRLAWIVIFAWVGFHLLVAVADLFRLGFDDTDDWENSKRSGMVLFTDHGTGCQYLGRVFSTLTPRLNAQGQHVGCKEVVE